MSTASATQSAMPGRRDRWLVLAAAFLGWMFDGLEMGIFPLVARPALQTMIPPDAGLAPDQFIGLWMGHITALFLVGAALGGLAFGWLGDRLGRVRAMVLSILTYSVFTGLCFFAQAPWHLGALRFLAAFGMGGEWSLGVALVMESWPRNKGPVLAGVIGVASNVGFVLVALIGIGFRVTTDSWRWIMIAGAAPAILAFAIQIWVPESEKWKRARTQTRTQPLREIFSGTLLRTTLLAIAFASVALIGTWGSVQWLPLWADQLTGGNQPAAKAVTLLAIGGGAIIGSFLGPLFGGRFGRRPAYFGLCLGSLVACGYLFRAVDAYGPVFLLMSFLVGGFTAAFYGWLPLYLPELFPTRVRATGQGVCYNAGRLFAAAGALTQGQLVAAFDGSYARAGALLTLIYALGMILIWFARETKGRPLPD